jgi:hypothetical protein
MNSLVLLTDTVVNGTIEPNHLIKIRFRYPLLLHQSLKPWLKLWYRLRLNLLPLIQKCQQQQQIRSSLNPS